MTCNVTCHWCGAREATLLCDEGMPSCSVCWSEVPEPSLNETEGVDEIAQAFAGDQRVDRGGSDRRLVALLKARPGMTAGEIADVLGIPEGARCGGRTEIRGADNVEARRHYGRLIAAVMRAEKRGVLRSEGDVRRKQYFVADPSRIPQRGVPDSNKTRWRMKRIELGACPRCPDGKAERGQLCMTCWTKKRDSRRKVAA